MSSNLPQPAYVSPPADATVTDTAWKSLRHSPSPREWIIAALLFAATLLSTSYAGLFYSLGDIGYLVSIRILLHSPALIVYGLYFSIPLTAILLAHELGHFLACRYYGVRCSPPFFIPIPVTIAGTLGAFIKIKSPFPNKRALFDIGVAGPIAGFVLTIPTLWIGLSLSRLIPKGALSAGGLSFGEPLIFRLLGSLLLGYSPDKQVMLAHPTATAAWIGLLVTSLNLLPIWQLDGGHIAYALWGRSRQKKLSIVMTSALIVLSFWGWPTPSYLLFAVLLLIIGMRMRFYHPPTLLDEESLGIGRNVIALTALVILILSFIPVPIAFT